jgi:hypothetical protein
MFKNMHFHKVELIFSYFLITCFFLSCNPVNSRTSQIGNINAYCLSENAWTEILKANSIENIKDSTFKEGLEFVKNHFIRPEYIIYFQTEPKEIVGCDYYSIRVAYNPKVSSYALDGLSSELNDKEQVRIRNRVLELILNYECEKGKQKIIESMKEPAIFSDEFYEK